MRSGPEEAAQKQFVQDESEEKLTYDAVRILEERFRENMPEGPAMNTVKAKVLQVLKQKKQYKGGCLTERIQIFILIR